MNLLATAQLDITESNYKHRAVNFGVLLVNFEFAPFETGSTVHNEFPWSTKERLLKDAESA